jgi:hypothetical protein
MKIKDNLREHSFQIFTFRTNDIVAFKGSEHMIPLIVINNKVTEQIKWCINLGCRELYVKTNYMYKKLQRGQYTCVKKFDTNVKKEYWNIGAIIYDDGGISASGQMWELDFAKTAWKKEYNRGDKIFVVRCIIRFMSIKQMKK